MTHFLEHWSAQVYALHKKVSLLDRLDHFNPNKVLALASQEANEYRDELNKPSQDQDLEKIRDEQADHAVLALSAAHVLLPGPLEIRYLNGYGKRSSALDETQKLVDELSESPNPRRDAYILTEILSRFSSIVIHSPVGPDAIAGFARTIQKVRQNYPAEIFTDIDPTTGIQVAESDLEAYSEHRLKGVRKIRKVKAPEKPLQRSDWLPFQVLLNAWQDPNALDQIDAELEDHKHSKTEAGVHVPSRKFTEHVVFNAHEHLRKQ